MNQNDPTAQGTQADGNVSDVNNTNQNGGDPNAGFQKRVDELTAKAGQFERQMQANQQTIAEQQAVIAQLIARGQQAAAPAPVAPEIDPEDEKKFGYLLNKALQPFKEQINQLTGAVLQNRINPEINEVQVMLKKLNNPTITGKYNQLMDLWQRNGSLQRGTYSPKDALNVAVGEFGLSSLLGEQQNQQDRNTFNQSFVPVNAPNGQGRQVAANNGGQGQVKAPEKDLTDMSKDELQRVLADIEKRNPEGFGM